MTDDEARKAPWYIRRRVGMTPFFAGLVAAIAAWASFEITANQTLAIVIGVIGSGMWLADKRWGRKELGVRNFAWFVMVAAGSFLLVVRFEWLPFWWNLVMLGVAVGGLGIFWWTDPGNRRKVKLERDQERWPILAKRINMPQVHRGPEIKTETGRKWRFWWDEGAYTLSSFKAQARPLESALGIPENHIRFENVYPNPGHKAPNTIYVVENTASTNSSAPVDFDRPTMRSICDPMFIGPFEDNVHHEVTWFDREFGGIHTLAGGQTGSGKSGLYHLVTAESCMCPDVVRWGIDAKGGMALRPWASLYDWILDDVDGSVDMLNAVHQILKARSKFAADQGWDVWQPSAEYPVLLVVVDEAAEVFGVEAFDMNSLGASIARMGRAAGVLFLIATQHPTNEALASTQLTKNLGRRFCFAVEDMAGQNIILPKSKGKVDATDIPIGPEFAGTYFCSDGGRLDERTARVRFVTKYDIFRLCVQIGADPSLTVSDLDQMSQQAAIRATIDEETGTSIYEQRRIWTAEDIRVPKGWTGPLPEGFRGIGTNDPARTGSAVDEDVTGDETFDDEVLGAPRTTVQGSGPAPHLPVQVGMAVPNGPVQVNYQGEQVLVPYHEEDERMDISTISEPRTPGEAAELDQAMAAYAAQYSERSLTPEQADRMLDELLAAAPPEGITIEAMSQVLGRKSSWYSLKLRERIHDGRCTKLATGRYVGTKRLVGAGSGGHAE